MGEVKHGVLLRDDNGSVTGSRETDRRQATSRRRHEKGECLCTFNGEGAHIPIRDTGALLASEDRGWDNCSVVSTEAGGSSLPGDAVASLTVTEAAFILVGVGRSRHPLRLQTRLGGPEPSQYRSMATLGSSDIGRRPEVRQEARSPS